MQISKHKLSRATLSAEDRAKFFPETPTYPPPIKTSDKRSSSQTPLPPFGNTPEDLWDVDLDDEVGFLNISLSLNLMF